jgi:hypothetical protein
MDYGNENLRKGPISIDWTIIAFLVFLIIILALLILIYDHGWEIVVQSGIRDSLEAFVKH